MAQIRSYGLHATGSTGNASSSARDVEPDVDKVALEVVIEAIGATPTVTIALEGSLDGTNFFALRFTPSSSETAASNVVLTTTGRTYYYYKNDLGQFVRYFRATSSANTNVTFSTNLWVLDNE